MSLLSAIAPSPSAGPSSVKLPHTLGLRGRLILLLLAAFGALGCMHAWRFVHERDDQINGARAELLGHARLMAVRQQSLLERGDAILNGLLMIPELMPGSSAEACAQFLAARLRQEPTFSQIGKMQPNGDVNCTAVPGHGDANGADRDWFQQTLQTREMIISDVIISHTLGTPVIALGKAMRDAGGHVTSVFYLSLGLEWLEQEVTRTQLPEGASLTVVDGRGAVVLRYPDQAAWTGKSAAYLPVVQHTLTEGGEGTLEGTGLGGAKMLFAHVPLLTAASGSHYQLLLAIPKQLLEAPARRDALFSLGAALAVLIATMGWVVVGGNRLLLKPLLRLSRTATRLKAGQFGARSGLPHGDDEIGRLAAALDETAAAIEDRDTERKLAERALRASEAQYRRLFEAAKDGILIVDVETGMIMDVNPFLIDILGYSHEAFLRKKLWEVGFFNDIVDNQANFEELQEKGYIRYENKALKTADGRRIEVEFVSNVYLVNDHKVIQCNIRDVTERKVAAQKIQAQMERAEALLEAAPDPVVIVDSAGLIVMVNARTEIVFGYPRAELLGQSVEMLIPERLRATHLAGRDLRARRRDGSELVVDVSLSPLATPEGPLVISTVRDVTERRQTEEQLRQAQKMEAIGNLTGGMAHDFNNLLGIIIGNLDLLRDRQGGDPDLDELTGEALDAALRGADLTRRLLAFARRQPLQPTRADVNELIVGIVKLLERTLGEQIQITLDLNPNTWPVIVDPAQLESGLTNLATNARDAMPGGGQLKIVTGNRSLDADYALLHAEVQPGDYAMIEVSDTGTGMPPEVASHVFEPFYTTKEPGKGTGLGLSMVFGFIKQSGGHINVYSEVGIGTILRLYLPRAEIGAEAGGAIMAAALVHGRGESVLAVEDNASLRRVVVRQLTELGYRVLEAEDAAAAFRILHSQQVDILFTDIVMPGGTSGYDLARTVLSRWPHIKVVLTSGFPENRTNGDANAPNLRLLSKPYRRDDLGRIIREALDA